MGQGLLIGVGGGVGFCLLIQQLVHLRIGGGIADGLGIGKADLRLQHKVDIHFRQLPLLALLGDAQAIGEKIAALHGDGEGKVGVVRYHGDGIAVIIGRHGRFPADHFIEYLIGDVGLNDLFLLLQQHHGLIHLLGAFGIQGQPQIGKGDAEGVLGVIDHQDIIHIGFAPQGAPAGHHRFVLYHFGIVDEPQHAPGIGHRILIGGVVGLVKVLFIDVLQVGDIGHIRLLQHPLGDHTGDHVVGGNDDIIDGTAGFQLGVHRFIGIVIGIDDPDAGDLLKGLVDIQPAIGTVGDILAAIVDADGIALILVPAVVVHIQHRGIDAGTGSQCGDRQQGSGHHKGRKKGENTLFHTAGPSFRIICFSLRAE